LTPDLARKLPGRGVWVSADADLIRKAAAKNLFARGLESRIARPDADALIAEIAAGLETRLAASLGLARRAGDIILGGEDAVGAVAANRAQLVLSAADAADRGVRRLQREAKAAGARHVIALSTRSLSHAVGAEGVKHLGVRRGRSAERILTDAQRLAGFGRATLDELRGDEGGVPLDAATKK